MMAKRPPSTAMDAPRTFARFAVNPRLQHLSPATPIDDRDADRPRRRRPKIVGIVGWVCAGIGYASFFLKGSQLPSYFAQDMLKKYVNPDWKPPALSRGQFSIAVSILFAEMFVALICMSGGLGALKMREWGRRLLIIYGITAIVLTLLKGAWQISMFDVMLDYQISATTQPYDRTAGGNAQFFALIVSTVSQLLWPAIVLSIVTRRYVKDAFDAARLGDGTSDGWRSSTTRE